MRSLSEAICILFKPGEGFPARFQESLATLLKSSSGCLVKSPFPTNCAYCISVNTTEISGAAFSPADPEKAKLIIEWFMHDNKPLRRHVAAIDVSESDPNPLRFDFLKFGYAVPAA